MSRRPSKRSVLLALGAACLVVFVAGMALRWLIHAKVQAQYRFISDIERRVTSDEFDLRQKFRDLNA